MGKIKTLFRKVAQVVNVPLTKFCDNVYRGGGIMSRNRRVQPKTYDVLDVSRYIINYSNKKEYGVSNLKLQKLLYFVQAHFLVLSNEEAPLFKEKIEAWDFGPVVPKAYNEYRQFGATSIPYIKSYFITRTGNIWDSERVPYEEDFIDEETRCKINDVVDSFSEKTATDLVGLTHRQKPWMDAYEKGMNNEITTESIRRYFNGKKRRE